MSVLATARCEFKTMERPAFIDDFVPTWDYSRTAFINRTMNVLRVLHSLKCERITSIDIGGDTRAHLPGSTESQVHIEWLDFFRLFGEGTICDDWTGDYRCHWTVVEGVTVIALVNKPEAIQ